MNTMELKDGQLYRRTEKYLLQAPQSSKSVAIDGPQITHTMKLHRGAHKKWFTTASWHRMSRIPRSAGPMEFWLVTNGWEPIPEGETAVLRDGTWWRCTKGHFTGNLWQLGRVQGDWKLEINFLDQPCGGAGFHPHGDMTEWLTEHMEFVGSIHPDESRTLIVDTEQLDPQESSFATSTLNQHAMPSVLGKGYRQVTGGESEQPPIKLVPGAEWIWNSHPNLRGIILKLIQSRGELRWWLLNPVAGKAVTSPLSRVDMLRFLRKECSRPPYTENHHVYVCHSESRRGV